MSTLHRQVRRARDRLWLNQWLDLGCWLLTAGATVFAIVTLLTRLFGWPVPLAMVAGGLAGLAVVTSLIWSTLRRPSDAVAAVALDRAAGLRERVSSSLYCAASDDPFAQAVRGDAETRVSSLTVHRHLRLRFPDSGFYAAGTLVLAALLLLVPEGLLQKADAKTRRQNEAQVTQSRVEVKKQLDSLKKIAQTNPALADLKADLEKLSALPEAKMDKPGDIRNEALKQIDKFADTVRQKQGDSKYDKLTETQKMLRAVQTPTGEKSPVQRLAQQLATGDFKAAQESIKDVQENLATLKHESDQQLVENLQNQLQQLAKQLDQVSSQEQLKKTLEQAGVKKEDAERMLQQLTKEDLEQVKKQLEQNGMTQQQIQQLAQKMQKQQAACQGCKQMSQSLSQAAQSAGQGQASDASSELQQAADQLSELESLEQEMNQLQSASAEAQNMKDQMGQGQGQCQGQGQRQGEGEGQGGLGPLGDGRGGLAPSEETEVGFKIQKQKVETTKGKIVGQFLVDGQQVKGDVGAEFVEVISAAERDATDAINRDRIPRQYQKAVKEYFSRLPALLGLNPPGDAAPATDAESEPAKAKEDPAAAGPADRSDSAPEAPEKPGP